jgi:hypothetical protein
MTIGKVVCPMTQMRTTDWNVNHYVPKRESRADEYLVFQSVDIPPHD